MAELASSYSRERELAFFVVNFGFTKRDYNELTEVEKAFIYKAYETKLVTEMTHLRNAVLNAINNAFRKKNKKFIELFKRKQAKADKEYNENAVKIITEMEKRDGKSWIDRIYKEAGLKRPVSPGRKVGD
ncbi:phenylalanine racemase [Phage Altai3]|nr:phenylalanine racemase [Phage Altai3]